jgi:8-oxo-dGTP diphosphatase
VFGATYRYCPSCATPLVEKQVGHTIRPVCPACGFIVFLEPKLVTVVVVQHNGRILLGKRNIDPGMGLWSFFGGYVDRGEQLEEAALREVKEETNLDVRLDGLIGLYSESGRPHILVAYRASVLNNDISAMAAQPEEVSEMAFFAPQEVPELAFPFDRQILQDWLGEI